MNEITEKALKIIESNPSGICQSDLWKILDIDSRLCSRIVARLVHDNYIERFVIKTKEIKTFLLKIKPSNEKTLKIIEDLYCDGPNNTFEKLIEEHRLLVNDTIFLPSYTQKITQYHVLEKPLKELLIEDLKNKRCSISDLAEKYEIKKQDIQNEITALIKEKSLFELGFILKRFPQTLSQEQKNVEYAYSIIPIPLKAKLFDPFLGFSLLDWNSYLSELENEIHILDKTEVIEEYINLIHTYWDIPFDVVEEHLSPTEFRFIDSILGPVPLIITPLQMNQISDLITENETVGFQLPIDNDIIRKIEGYIRKAIKKEFSDIIQIQYCVISLAEAKKFSRVTNQIALFDELNTLNKSFFTKLFTSPKINYIQLRDDQNNSSPNTRLPYNKSGNDNHNLTFETPSDNFIIRAEYNGSNQFSLFLRTNGRATHLFTTKNRETFSKIISTKKGRIINIIIDAEGPWFLKIDYPESNSIKKIDLASFIGNGNQVSNYFILTEGPKKILIKKFNIGQITVKLKDKSGEIIQVLDANGPLEKTFVFKNDCRQICIFEIQTIGKWFIVIRNE